MKYPSRRRKNLLILILSMVVAFVLSRQDFFRDGLLSLEMFGYLGAFIGGILFTSSFTVFFSLAILTTLSQELSLIPMVLIAGLGALVGDHIFLRFFKNEIIKDLEPIYEQFGGTHLHKILHTKYFSWTLPVIGAAMIASPLPNEIGISLLSLGHLPPLNFLLISYGFNTLGILFIALAGNLL